MEKRKKKEEEMNEKKQEERRKKGKRKKKEGKKVRREGERKRRKKEREKTKTLPTSDCCSAPRHRPVASLLSSGHLPNVPPVIARTWL